VALKKQNANLRTVKAQLEKRLHETQNQLVAERKEHTKTRDQLTATARQNDILANALAESKGAINSLRTKLEEAGRSLSISESNSQEAIQNSALLEKLASRLQHEHSKMGRELASAVTAREEAQGKLAGVEAARKEAEGKANQLSSKLQTAHADLSTLQREKAELLKTINTKATALKAAKQQYNAEVARSNQRHQEATAQILAMKKNGEAESKKNAELLAQTELNGIEGAESVQAELKEMTKLRGDLQKSNAALKALQNDTLELRNISDLTAERLKRTRQQVVAMSEEKQALKEALKKRESEIAELQANLDKSHISETAQTEQQEE
jgi:chromosome segregation ATPase